MAQRRPTFHSADRSNLLTIGPANKSAPAIRPLFQGVTLLGVKKRGHGSRSWTQIDQDGNSQVLEIDKLTLMRRCNLPARDLRLLDPLFVYPSSILGREKAIVVNLEQIRCIITADEVILLNSLDGCVTEYQLELCKRLAAQKDLSDDLPFEFRALEVALELTCTFLDAQATELENEVYPVLDGLASSISTLKLERVRRMKSHLLALTQRVQKIHDEIEQLMNDDGDMAEMYLTEKKEQNEAYFLNNQHMLKCTSGPGAFRSASVSPVLSPTGSPKLEKDSCSFASRSKYGSLRGSGTNDEHIRELEMLLEAYFVVIDNTLNKLSSLKEYIDDTEDFINIKLDNIRNQLIQIELLITAATFVVTIFAVVTGIFGMNIPIDLFDYPSAFNWVLIISTVVGGLMFLLFLWYFKHKRLMFM